MVFGTPLFFSLEYEENAVNSPTTSNSALQQLSIAWADPGIQPMQYVRVLGMAGRPGLQERQHYTKNDPI